MLITLQIELNTTRAQDTCIQIQATVTKAKRRVCSVLNQLKTFIQHRVIPKCLLSNTDLNATNVLGRAAVGAHTPVALGAHTPVAVGAHTRCKPAERLENFGT